jgi:hypothetical protein
MQVVIASNHNSDNMMPKYFLTVAVGVWCAGHQSSQAGLKAGAGSFVTLLSRTSPRDQRWHSSCFCRLVNDEKQLFFQNQLSIQDVEEERGEH